MSPYLPLVLTFSRVPRLWALFLKMYVQPQLHLMRPQLTSINLG